MTKNVWKSVRMQEYMERHGLTIERLRSMVLEDVVQEPFSSYFQYMAVFLLELESVRRKIADNTWERMPKEDMAACNRALYMDILPEYYEKSYGNPAYAEQCFGEKYGAFFSLLYAELRSGIAYAFENRIDYLTILNELFIEIYNIFEEGIPKFYRLKNILYWYASDYCDVFYADRILEQLYPERSFATDIIMNADLTDERYLYRFGEYITNNERETARYLQKLPEETIRKMADVYTEGYRIGFVNTGKDLSKKSVVNIRYCLGFERVVRQAVKNFEAMGLSPVIYRAASGIITKREQFKVGYYGAIANKQYDYDHRSDQALIADKRYLERKLDVLRNVYEKNRQQAAQFAGPAVIEIFGEKPFSPEVKESAYGYNETQKKLIRTYDGKTAQVTEQYIKGEERSFTIIAYPSPEIGRQYEEIFDEVIKINTLDADLYTKVQQKLIDALDAGDYVHIKGKYPNQTDLKVNLWKLRNPEKETIFENCVADVNIPVGEVFTSPVLEGTEGILHVSRVYLNELQFLDLKLKFTDGMVTDYNCGNFEKKEDNRKYISDNLLYNHDTLPLGEFAIGTNTTAYVVGKKYHIEDKFPILIAEKTGPHFAVGDTCYSRSEEIKVYNPNGKEIVARDNSISVLRKTDIEKAYFQCHTDITIPYEELEKICVVTKEGKKIILLQNGRFVLPGTEVLNVPFENENNK